jgi:hypothetical protein
MGSASFGFLSDCRYAIGPFSRSRIAKRVSSENPMIPRGNSIAALSSKLMFPKRVFDR